MKEKIMNWKFLQKAENYIKQNGSTISMVGAMGALGLAIYSAFKASNKVSEIYREYNEKVEDINERWGNPDEFMDDQLDWVEKTKVESLKEAKTMRNLKYILAYKFVILWGGSSLALMFLSKYIDGLAIAGLTTLAYKNQEKLETFVNNAKEMIGEEKFKEIENKSLEDLLMENFTDGPAAYQLKHGEGVVFLEPEAPVLFQMKPDDLKSAIDYAEDYCNRNHGLFLEKWYSMLGLELPEKKLKDRLCWGPKRPFKAKIEKREFPTLGITVNCIVYDKSAIAPMYAGLPSSMW